ncbi:hypothetical protein CF319_g6262 [Tilletia indica]|uniref:Thioesterase domain-containing protein n=1 Tax=Tilletia indica TaxID=43049 RepID=A0A177T8K1_9BASI|nr:hypothetical protein CF319_g6262 [Tilletia indica]KAE8233727.1 hypothetical protein CF326_g1229 [Tilletia indica]KAE8249971.1 hypothetical protein A4X13_0g5001 [Tilletia indica]
MAPPPLRKYPFTLPIQSRFPDADMYHHINNVQYYIYADTIINTYLIDNCGLQPASATASPIGLMISSSCNFYAPLHFPAIIQTGLCVRKMGKSSVEYEIGIWEKPSQEGKEGVLAAVVRCTHVFVDRETRVPVGKGKGGSAEGLPQKMREGLEKILMKEEAGRDSRL